MLGKHNELAFKKWYLKASKDEGVGEEVHVIRSQGVGIPDYCITRPKHTGNIGIFVEVKYKEFGKPVPSFKILRKQQRVFFYNFNYIAFLAYKTSTTDWNLFYYSIKQKRFKLTTKTGLFFNVMGTTKCT